MASRIGSRRWNMRCSSAAALITRKADTFVGMYVNDWTLDFGQRGREAVRELLARGHAAGVIPKLVEPEFVAKSESE